MEIGNKKKIYTMQIIENNIDYRIIIWYGNSAQLVYTKEYHGVAIVLGMLCSIYISETKKNEP